MRLDVLRLMVERLKKVHAEKPEEFDIRFWKSEDCGTVACAVGHCVDLMPNMVLTGVNFCARPRNTQTHNDSFLAISESLEISLEQAYRFFSGDYYESGDKTTALDVANKIEIFLIKHSD